MRKISIIISSLVFRFGSDPLSLKLPHVNAVESSSTTDHRQSLHGWRRRPKHVLGGSLRREQGGEEVRV